MGKKATPNVVDQKFMISLQHDGVNYELSDDGTATVVENPQLAGSITIPESIQNGAKSYDVVSIGKKAFANSQVIELRFAENSKVSIFCNRCFFNSKIQHLEVPDSLTTLEKGWNVGIHELKVISIQNNPKYQFVDDCLVQKNQPINDSKSDQPNNMSKATTNSTTCSETNSQACARIRAPTCSETNSQACARIRAPNCSETNSQACARIRAPNCSETNSQTCARIRAPTCSETNSRACARIRAPTCSDTNSKAFTPTMRKMKKSTNTKQTQKPLTVPKIEDNSTYTLLLAPKHIRYLEIEKISIFGSHACANCKHLVDLKYKNEFYIDDLDFKIEEKAFFNCPKLIFFQKTEKDPKTYGPGRSKLLKQDNYGFIFYGIRIDNFGNVYDFDTYSRFPYDKNKGKLHSDFYIPNTVNGISVKSFNLKRKIEDNIYVNFSNCDSISLSSYFIINKIHIEREKTYKSNSSLNNPINYARSNRNSSNVNSFNGEKRKRSGNVMKPMKTELQAFFSSFNENYVCVRDKVKIIGFNIEYGDILKIDAQKEFEPVFRNHSKVDLIFDPNRLYTLGLLSLKNIKIKNLHLCGSNENVISLLKLSNDCKRIIINEIEIQSAKINKEKYKIHESAFINENNELKYFSRFHPIDTFIVPYYVEKICSFSFYKAPINTICFETSPEIQIIENYAFSKSQIKILDFQNLRKSTSEIIKENQILENCQNLNIVKLPSIIYRKDSFLAPSSPTRVVTSNTISTYIRKRPRFIAYLDEVTINDVKYQINEYQNTKNRLLSNLINEANNRKIRLLKSIPENYIPVAVNGDLQEIYFHPCLNRGYQKPWDSYILYEKVRPFNLSQIDLISKLSPTKKVCIALEILKGLEFIHDLGVYHQNLNPSNILLTQNFHVKISRISESFNCFSFFTDGIEKAYFVYPELVRSEISFNYRADVYSFGLILYYLANNKNLDLSIEEKFSAKIPHKTKNPGCLAEWAWKLIIKCLKSKYSISNILNSFKSNDYQMFNDMSVDQNLIELRLIEIDDKLLENASQRVSMKVEH